MAAMREMFGTLRDVVMVTVNAWNARIRSDNTSGYRGCTYSKREGKWKAQIVTNGRHISLGLFNTPEEAARAYDRAARELRDQFARTNFEPSS